MALLIVLFDQLGFGLWGVMVPLWFYILGTGFTFPCVQVLALAKPRRPRRARPPPCWVPRRS